MAHAGDYDHVVFVSIDTMRSDVMAANPMPLWPLRYPGLRAPRTPVLDDLAGRGAYFPNMITAAPYTAAAHGSILTGQFPIRHGLHEFYNGRLRSPTVFTYGRRVGRRTVMNVDFPIILGPQLGYTQDIDTYLTERDDDFVDAVVSADSTVALAHFGGVHLPYGFHNLRFGGDAYRRKVAELEEMLPADVPPLTDQLVESFRDAEDTDLLLRYKRAVNHFYAQGSYDLLFQLYLDGVEHFLASRFEPFLEKLTERVARTGKRMLLVLFADHGHEFDAHSYGHFNSMNEGVLRVPLMVVGPDVAPGTFVNRIRTVDIAPTVMELAGIPVPSTGVFDGASLAATVRGKEPAPEDRPALAEAYTSDTREFVAYQQRQLRGEPPGPLKHVLVGQAAYLDQRKLTRVTRRYQPGFAGIDEVDISRVERFDDRRVPHEDPAADPTDLRQLLEDYRAALQPPVPVSADDTVRQQLRALGYTV
ncbi:sulfatase-like hydrolase/transferase [Micromonospora maritima]|uniref:sulfatase-like hydrolase/transferase n=1 Tax=Micromonospora maritima TaxID=986711 RepID=UPI0037945F7C